MEVREESPRFLDEYARVSIAFEVDRMLDLAVLGDGLDGFSLVERPVRPSVTKDYDAIPGGHPSDWARQFDLSNWAFLSARLDGEHVGGAAVAFRTPGLFMLEGRSDLAVVWDIRVAPAARGRGIGAALFGAAEQWAGARGCRLLKVETQNINVPACRFYARQGCDLGALHRFAYPEQPDEVQILWYKRL